MLRAIMFLTPETLFGMLRFLTFGLLTLLFVLWLVSVAFPGHCAGWGFAFWFPLTAVSAAASLIVIGALPTLSRSSSGMGEGFAKFGALVLVSYGWPAVPVLLISLFRFPRRTGDFRFASILMGIGLLVGFAVTSHSLFTFPRVGR